MASLTLKKFFIKITQILLNDFSTERLVHSNLRFSHLSFPRYHYKKALPHPLNFFPPVI